MEITVSLRKATFKDKAIAVGFDYRLDKAEFCEDYFEDATKIERYFKEKNISTGD